jgi:hypothetical protein
MLGRIQIDFKQVVKIQASQAESTKSQP